MKPMPNLLEAALARLSAMLAERDSADTDMAQRHLLRRISPVFALCLSLPLCADPRTIPTADPDHTSETGVSGLLALQRSGQFASAQKQTLPGDAQSRLWQRYLDSFARPIPVRFIDDAFKEK